MQTLEVWANTKSCRDISRPFKGYHVTYIENRFTQIQLHAFESSTNFQMEIKKGVQYCIV